MMGYWHAPGSVAYISAGVCVSNEPNLGMASHDHCFPMENAVTGFLPGSRGQVGQPTWKTSPRLLTQYFFVFLADTPIEEFTPTPAFPALQYLESVDEGGVAWQAGLRTGDFLIEVGNRCLYHAAWGERRLSHLSHGRGLWF